MDSSALLAAEGLRHRQAGHEHRTDAAILPAPLHRYDFRWTGTQAICPWSQTPDGIYQWLGPIIPAGDLPKLKVSDLRVRARRRLQSSIAPEFCDPGSIVYGGKAYVDRFDRRAVGGQGGHTSLFIAAKKIVGFVRRLGGGEQEAWQLLLYYNATKCDPPWDVTNPGDEAALRHKLHDAMKKQR